MSRSVHNTHILSEIDRTTSVNRASYILLRRNLGITWWNKWRLKYRSWAIDCMYKDCQLFDGFKKRCQTWHRLLSTRSIPCHVWHRFLTPCLASKSFQTSYLQSLAQPAQTSLQLYLLLTSIWYLKGEMLKLCNRLQHQLNFLMPGRASRNYVRHWIILVVFKIYVWWLILFLDTMPGVKKLSHILPAMTHPISSLIRCQMFWTSPVDMEVMIQLWVKLNWSLIC